MHGKRVGIVSIVLCSITILVACAKGKPELVLQTFFDGKVEILVPTSLKPMDEDLLDSKYARTNAPPKIAFTNDDASVNLVLDIKKDADLLALGLEGALENMFATTPQRIPSFKMFDSGIVLHGGEDFAYVKFTIQAPDALIYNVMYFTIIDDKFYFASFNSTEKHWGYWEKYINEIMSSFKVH